jgi:hypothetical protein
VTPVTVFGKAYLFNRFTHICTYHICYGLYTDAVSRYEVTNEVKSIRDESVVTIARGTEKNH